MKKKQLSLVLVLALCLGLAIPTMAAGNFTDVKVGAYYADAVAWAVEQGITSGTSVTTFSPDQTCTTAQIITFLWRANGSPKPMSENTFSDITSGDYYDNAAQWAKEKSLVTGETFNGNTPCTRSATVTYLWKLAGSPAAAGSAFADVPTGASFAQAVDWAVENKITSGTSQTTFSPEDTCTRGQIVTFLHRTYSGKHNANMVDFLDMGGSYRCNRLDVKLVVDTKIDNSGYHISYTFWNIEYNDMIQQATPGAVFNHLRDYGVDFYDDFLVVIGYNETGHLFDGVYIKEGHTLPDWAKKEFADLISG